MTDFHIITRRKFIGTAATVAAVSSVPRHVFGGSNQKARGEKLNIAGIGVGGMGAANGVVQSELLPVGARELGESMTCPE